MGGRSAPLPLLTTETQLLEMLGNGAPMMEVLNELCNFIDARSPGAITTVFLLDSNGTRLKPVAGPKAPKTWREEIDKVDEGPYAGFCSTAVDQGRLLIAGDLSSAPLFAVHREAALREGLQIACLKPILSIEKQILGVLALSYPRQQRRRLADSEMIERAIHLAAIAIQCHRNEEELRDLSRRLSQSQDEERRCIARDLHDSTGQKLSVMAMNLALAENQARSAGVALNRMLSDCSSLTRDISDEIRTLSYLLHPPLLDECGLESAIQVYAGGINRREGLEIELDIPHHLQRLSEEAELAVFRIVQASLTNIHLHSGSNKARIKIQQIPEGLRVTIADLGRGIPKGVLGRYAPGKGAGVGIVGMRERMKRLGGRLEIDSSERGTEVRVVIPRSHFRQEKVAAAAEHAEL
jgi:signal transduction histidine kinase